MPCPSRAVESLTKTSMPWRHLPFEPQQPTHAGESATVAQHTLDPAAPLSVRAWQLSRGRGGGRTVNRRAHSSYLAAVL